MDDLISRQAAIEALDNIKIQRNASWYTFYQLALTAMSNLPSAQPERKKGKWIETDDGWDGVYYECSCCKEAFTLMDGTPTDNLYNYCPNCGSYNGGDEE